MNNYLRVFLTAIVFVAFGYIITLGSALINKADDMLNMIGMLILIVDSIGLIWFLHIMWIKPFEKKSDNE